MYHVVAANLKVRMLRLPPKETREREDGSKGDTNRRFFSIRSSRTRL